jgi:copper chaperone CopZ
VLSKKNKAMTHTYSISGMTCSGCVAKVKSELLKVPGVTEAQLQLDSPQATISMEQHIATQVLQQAVAAAGNYTLIDHHVGMEHPDSGTSAANGDSYLPLILIFAYITGITLLIQWNSGPADWMQGMRHFMAGFFLVFSFFKLMKLQAFAEGYRSYDMVARYFPAWAYIYPFIELLLGLAFLTGWAPLTTNWITLIVMGISTVGVARALVRKTKFRCACLGTVINLPLSKVTFFEDLLMVLMSALMIIAL